MSKANNKTDVGKQVPEHEALADRTHLPASEVTVALARAHDDIARMLWCLRRRLEEEGIDLLESDLLEHWIDCALTDLECAMAELVLGQAASRSESRAWLCAAYRQAGIHSF
jgi:hypothetical protein